MSDVQNPPPESKKIRLWITYLVGLVFTAVMTICAVQFISLIIWYWDSPYFQMNWPLRLGIDSFMFFSVFVRGLIRPRGPGPTEITHFVGVITFFGKRIEMDWVLDEGWSWVLPRPIMSAISVDMRPRIIQVPPEKNPPDPDARGFPVIAIGLAEENGKREQKIVKMEARMIINWKPLNASRLLNIDENVVKGNLVNTAVAELRAIAANPDGNDDLQLMAKKDTEVTGKIEEKMTKANSPEWGIAVTHIGLPKLEPWDQSVIDSYQLVRIEDRQREAEVLQKGHVDKMIKDAMDKFNIGFDAAEPYVMNQIGKRKANEVRVTGASSSLDRAAAIVFAGNQDRPQPQQEAQQQKGKGKKNAPGN